MSGRSKTVERLMLDPAYAERVETALMMILAGTVLADVGQDEDDATVEVNVVETFTEAGFIGGKGLVLYMSDGAEVRLQITAGVPGGAAGS
jgi:hypothetical protein